MQNPKTKIVTAIAILFTILLTASTLLSAGFGAFPPAGTEVPTYSKINVGPDPTGVDQTVTINIFNAIPTFTSESYIGMTVTVTDPTQHTQTLGPFDSDTTGGTFTTFIPDQVGIWTFQMHYPGQTLSTGVIQLPDDSPIYELTVQEEPVTRESYPAPPGPQEWWETPVTAMNAENSYWHMGEWWGLSGISFESTGTNYYGGNYQPYSDSVYSGHVIWTKPWGNSGGVAGGESGPDQISGHYWTTRQYQPQYAPIIMQGVMYATLWTTSQTNGAQNGIIATDLFTGETLWTIDTYEELQVGWAPIIHNINEYGTRGPYLITYGDHEGVNTTGTTYNIYDASTGKYMASIVNGTSMVWEIADDRDLNGYFYSEVDDGGTTMRYLNRWDMTQCLDLNGNRWGITQGREYEFTDGINMTAPMKPYTDIQGVTDEGPLLSGFFGAPVRLNEVTDGTCVFTGGFTFGQGFGGTTNGYLVVFCMDADTGAYLWGRNITNSEADSLLPYTRTEMGIIDGMWINTNMENYAVDAFDVRTGVKAWETTLTGDNGGLPHYYDQFNIRWSPGPGVSIIRGFGGDAWCIENTDGTIRWYTNTTKLVGAPGAENPYGIWPFWVFECDCISNNIAYLNIGHEYNPPMFPGAQMCAISIADGTLVWSELGMYIRSTSLAYDTLLSLNAYDNQIYAFRKGPSEVTVSADSYGTEGVPMVIKGTVMDVSAGASQSEVAKRYPNGLPAVSDPDQSHFMEHVYQDQQLDYDVAGVTVDVWVDDPNGNHVKLGSTTSRGNTGVWGLEVTPSDPGLYVVTAVFEGTNSYWGSSAETYMYIGEAPSPGIEPTAEPSHPIISAEVAIGIAVVAVVIVGAAAYLVLRRTRK